MGYVHTDYMSNSNWLAYPLSNLICLHNYTVTYKTLGFLFIGVLHALTLRGVPTQGVSTDAQTAAMEGELNGA